MLSRRDNGQLIVFYATKLLAGSTISIFNLLRRNPPDHTLLSIRPSIAIKLSLLDVIAKNSGKLILQLPTKIYTVWEKKKCLTSILSPVVWKIVVNCNRVEYGFSFKEGFAKWTFALGYCVQIKLCDPYYNNRFCSWNIQPRVYYANDHHGTCILNCIVMQNDVPFC